MVAHFTLIHVHVKRVVVQFYCLVAENGCLGKEVLRGGVVDLPDGWAWTGLTPAIYISGERGFTEEKGDKFTQP